MKKGSLHSGAWLLLGFSGSEPGTLTLSQGRLRFDTEAGSCTWDTALKEIDRLEFPWYYFGGGMKVKIGRKRYRVSFIRPNTGSYISESDLVGTLPGVKSRPGMPTHLGETVNSMGLARRIGKAWKQVLTKQ